MITRLAVVLMVAGAGAAATRNWIGGSPTTAQVDSITPANVEIGDVFTVTITDDAGGTVAIAFTATAATVANVTAGLAAAFNASGDFRATAITASDQTTFVRLTADTPGVPFAATSAATDGGGANTQTLVRAAVTANAGPNDFNTAANWRAGVVPTGTGDDVYIEPGASSILYGLNQSSTVFGEFRIRAGATASVGRIANGTLFPLRLSSASQCYFEGTGSLVAVDYATTSSQVNISGASASGGSGEVSAYMLSGLIARFTCNGPTSVTIGGLGRTATMDSGHDSYISAGQVTFRQGCTFGANHTVYVQNGSPIINSYVATPEVIIRGYGTPTYRQREGAWTTMEATVGNIYPDAGTAYTTTKLVYPARLVIDATAGGSRTFTNTSVWGVAAARAAGVEMIPIEDSDSGIVYTNDPVVNNL